MQIKTTANEPHVKSLYLNYKSNFLVEISILFKGLFVCDFL